MDADLIFSLIERFDESSLSEVNYKDGDSSLVLKKKVESPPVYTQPVMVQPHPMHPQGLAMSSGTMIGGNAPNGGAEAGTGGPQPPSGTAQGGASGQEQISDAEVITAPIVGTFYRTPAPDAEPFVSEGDIVDKGQTLCILEAMKVMNELEAEFTMEIVRIPASNGEMVEYGTPLFEVRRV